MIRADVDGWGCNALAFDLEDFLDAVETEDGPRPGDGRDCNDGDD